MKIKLKAMSCSPLGVFKAGSIVDFPEDKAKALIAGNYAELIEKEPEKEAPIENKSLDISEDKKVKNSKPKKGKKSKGKK